MEGLTLAAVNHLPSACVFVMDLSGTCGAQSAPQLQLAVRAVPRGGLRERDPSSPRPRRAREPRGRCPELERRNLWTCRFATRSDPSSPTGRGSTCAQRRTCRWRRASLPSRCARRLTRLAV